MTRHTASPSVIGYDISEVDADGVGRHVFSISAPFARPQAAQDAARLLTLALSLPGGIHAATALLRAEMARQS